MRNQNHWNDMVLPVEMTDAQRWLEHLMALQGAACDGVVEDRPTVACLRQGFGELQIGQSVRNEPLCLAGRVYASGLGTHTESDLLVHLPAPGRRLTGLCGVQETPATQGMTRGQIFSVEIEGREAWRSTPLDFDSPAAKLDLPLRGARRLLLKVRGPERKAHVNWADLCVTLNDGRTLEIGQSGVASSGQEAWWRRTSGCPRPGSWGWSFRYGGRPSAEILHGWKLKVSHSAERDGFRLHRVMRTDPRTGLAVIGEIKEYIRFPVVEWGLRFKNTSSRQTPILEDIRSMDVELRRGTQPRLHYLNGDDGEPDIYDSFTVPLTRGEEYRFAPDSGRPTDRAWPYYNLEWSDTECGVIAVIGWAGQWASRFNGLDRGTVHVAAGQELTHFRLLPGEEIRTPLSVLMFYRGTRERSQNLWRRWMMAHNMPRLHPGKLGLRRGTARPGGCLPAPFHAANWGREMPQADEASQLDFFDRWRAERLRPDVWWMDAGWVEGGDWLPTRKWEADRQRFPRGMRGISDHLHRHGSRCLLWFEPEQIRYKTNAWLTENHPDWVLRVGGKHGAPGPGERALLNLGNPQAWRWLVNHYSRLIVEEGIDVYRQDFNFGPLTCWRDHDAPDRQGITEIRHIEGYLAFWKELRRRFPEMLIDACASGGRRNDLETLRLSVPLHKTDYNYSDQPAKQSFHQALFQWIPFFGAGVSPENAYATRTAFAPCLVTGHNVLRRDLDYDGLRALIGEWRRITPFYYGDYYPLTPQSRDETQWIAWQFHQPGKGDGVVQAFRRTRCAQAERRLPLRELDAGARYDVEILGSSKRPVVKTGRELMDAGLSVVVTQAPGAVTMMYRKKAC